MSTPQFIPTPESETEPSRIARELHNSCIFRLSDSLSWIAQQSCVFSQSAARPGEILAAMGSAAGLWVRLARAHRDHIIAVADILGVQTSDLLPDESLDPARGVIVHDDGTAAFGDPT